MLWLAVFYILALSIRCDTINQLIYKQIDFSEVRCIRMNNRNSQIGCQTGRDGDTGVLYHAQTQEDIDIIPRLNLPPVIVIVSASFFTNYTVEQFKSKADVRGMIVLEDEKPRNFSPDKPCPNDGFGFGESVDITNTKSCSQNTQKWNPNGNWLSYLDLPFGVFLIRNKTDIEFMKNKSISNVISNTLKSYPLWSGEMSSFMQSAVDTPTCMRRDTCDPIGGRNVVVNLIPRSPRPQRILVCVKADAVAYFHDLSYGGEANAAGIVTQFAIMAALSKARDDGILTDKHHDVMFAFFQGESFDYVGSQRMAYDLKNGKFHEGGTNITFAHITSIIEIGHVGLYSSKYYTHFSPNSSADTSSLRKHFTDRAVNLTFADSPYLPPASVNSFLREQENIPAIVVSDGNMEFTTNYFGSRFDTLSVSDELTTRLTNLATTVSRVVFQAVGGTGSPNITADKSLVEELLDCYLVTQNCSMFRTILNGSSIPDKKLSRFSSVYTHLTNPTQYVYGVSIRLSRKDLKLTVEQCNNSFTGYKVDFINGTCYGHATNYTMALSPAFLLKDYASIKYSTWTESRWSPVTKLRLFEMSSPLEGIVLFAVGLGYFVIVSLILLQCVRRKDLIFSDLVPVT